MHYPTNQQLVCLMCKGSLVANVSLEEKPRELDPYPNSDGLVAPYVRHPYAYADLESRED